MGQLSKLLRTRKSVLLATIGFGVIGMLIYKLSIKAETPFSAILMLLLAVLFAIGAAIQPVERKNYMMNHRWTRESLLYLPAVLFLLLDTVLSLLQKSYLFGLCSLVTVAGMGWMVWCNMINRQPHNAAPAMITAAGCIRLVLCYRSWNIVPQVSTFYYALFAEICILVFSYELLVFCIKEGKRRLSIGLVIMGAFFATSAAFGGGGATLCHYIGWLCFLMAELGGLLAKPKKKRVRRVPQVPVPDAAEI